MKTAVFGSKGWTDYSDLMRQLTVFIQDSHAVGHDNITFVHTGSKGAETMITEYIGKTEKFLRQKDFRIKEELIRGKAQVINDLDIIESGIEFALIFSDGCKRTLACSKLLKEYNIPYRIIESA
jgi:hypothetical protein